MRRLALNPAWSNRDVVLLTIVLVCSAGDLFEGFFSLTSSDVPSGLGAKLGVPCALLGVLGLVCIYRALPEANDAVGPAVDATPYRPAPAPVTLLPQVSRATRRLLVAHVAVHALAVLAGILAAIAVVVLVVAAFVTNPMPR